MLHYVIRLIDKVVHFQTAKAQSITVYEMSIRAVMRRQQLAVAANRVERESLQAR